MVIGGWIFDVNVIKAPLNRISMPFVAAISFFSTGISLYLLSRFYEGKQSVGIIVIPICLLVVFLFMTTSLISLFFNVHTGIETAIENILTKNENVNVIIPSARPPVLASIIFILSAAAQTSVISGYVRSNKLLQISGMIIMTLASVVIIGHILNQPSLFHILPWSNDIPTHGAIGFEIIGMSLILLGKIDYKQNIRIETNTIKTRLIFLLIGFMVTTISIFSFWSYDVAITPRPLQEVTYTIAIMTSVILSTVSVYAIIISRSISSGITKLRTVSEEIKKGRQDVKADTNSNDEIGYLGKSFNDMVEDIKKKEEKLRQMEILKEEFSAMVTHELKTPIMPILWHCKMLKEEMAGKLNAEQIESIESIEKNTNHLKLLISDIMDARKLDLDKMRFNFEPVSLDEFFTNLDISYKNSLANKGITFTTEHPSGITVNTDKIRLRQVFDNIIGNSIKFVPQNHGQIDVIVDKKEKDIAILIRDNGSGIPPEKQKELFQKFYQVDTSETRKISGTGLGLAISKGIMEGLGGSIRLESDGKTGTAVHLSLPVK